MNIIYQGKEYTIEELRREQKLFEKSLEVPEYLQMDQVYDFVCLNPGYKLAIDFLGDLYFQITSARFALIMGHKKLHDSNYVSWDSGALGQIWLRSQYLRNAIVWYNSSYDLLWQAIWFGYSLFRKIGFGKPPQKIQDVNSTETFQKLLRSCTYDKLCFALSAVEISEGSDKAKELLEAIKEFNDYKQQKKVREWANSLKHRGSFKVKELYHPRSGLTAGDFDSQYTKPLIVGIDEIPEILKDYHIAFCKLIRFTFSFFDFESMIPEKTEGAIYLDREAEEKDYKKIFIR